MPEPARLPAWDDYLVEYHDANPGITEDVLTDAHDVDGRSPYEWLVEAVPPARRRSSTWAAGADPSPACSPPGDLVAGARTGARPPIETLLGRPPPG